MQRFRHVLSLLLIVACFSTGSVAPRPAVAADLAPDTRLSTSRVLTYTSRLPSDGFPAPVLVVLHGMGGSGEEISAPWLPVADERGWIVVAPTFSYGDWHDPVSVRADDKRFSEELAATLADLPNRVDRPIASKVLIFGFSRGAQLAHRYALYHPEQVQAVAALSAGTYTLPDTQLWINNKAVDLKMPFGVADMDRWIGHACNQRALARIPFWIGVGANDNRVEDVPRDWDPYIGKTRVQRARSFVKALERHHITAQLTEFPGADHEFGPAILRSALGFFDGQTALSGSANFALAPAAGADSLVLAANGS